MTERSPPRGSPRKPPPIDRRAQVSESDNGSASLRKVKAVLARPLGLERRDGQLRLVLVERRRTAPADQAPLLARIIAELHARLSALTDAPTAQPMRHLARVGAELERGGWSRVGALPEAVLGKALGQAEMLAGDRPPELLAIFIERLRRLAASAEVREARLARLPGPNDPTLEVSEATQEEFEASQRSWAGSAPLPRAGE